MKREKTPVASPFQETLSDCLQAAQAVLDSKDIVLDNEENRFTAFDYDGIRYDTHKEAHEPILTIKGKPTRKWAHLTIWRLSSGRYEWNLYIM